MNSEITLDQALIDKIVNQAVSLLFEKAIAAAPKQRVLILFSGAGSGYVVGMQAIQMLAKADHSLTVVMTASARHVIGAENVRKAGAEHLIADNEWVNTPKLVREIDLVLMPTLSMNTAAHLALGLMDSLICTLVLGSLLADKPVIAICDGANPYGNGGRVFSNTNTSAPVLREKIADHLTTLMNFGIQLVKEEAFLFSLVNRLGESPNSIQPAEPLPTSQNSSAARPKPAAAAAGGILTAADLMVYPHGSTVRLASGTKLTPLAQEAVYRQMLHLVYE